MSQTLEQKSSSDGFIKAGELIEIRGAHALTLQDGRIFDALVENAGPAIADNKSHRIALWRLRGQRHKGGERVRDSIKRLMTTLVEVPVEDANGKPATLRTALVAGTITTNDENDPRGEVVYSFSNELRVVLKQSQYWARIKSYVVFAFSSKYALRLYEAVALRVNLRTGTQRLTVAEFRGLLGVEPGKLAAFPQLKQKVLTPAVEEVNALSDFVVEVEPIRQGGAIRGVLAGFRLTWRRKEPEEWRATLDELRRPKIGRKTRIRGEVDEAA